MKNTSNELPVMLFETKKDWEAWLDENHATSNGVWLQLAKKASKLQTVSYAEAVEVALCYGWIDSQMKTYDTDTSIQKFTPRGKRSIWSKINTEKAEKLIERGLMKPAGLQAIESAKQDGRWQSAYESSSKATIPKDFQKELDKNPKAQAFFDKLNRQNRYAILFRIQTAKKPETRAKRIQQFISMLEKNEKIYP